MSPCLLVTAQTPTAAAWHWTDWPHLISCVSLEADHAGGVGWQVSSADGVSRHIKDVKARNAKYSCAWFIMGEEISQYYAQFRRLTSKEVNMSNVKCAILWNKLTNIWKSLSASPHGPLQQWQVHSLVFSQLSQNHALVRPHVSSRLKKRADFFEVSSHSYSSCVQKSYWILNIYIIYLVSISLEYTRVE